MSIEIIVGLLALVFGLVAGGFGWSQIKKHGAENEKRKSAQGERDEAIKREKQSNSPDLDDDQHDDFIDRL